MVVGNVSKSETMNMVQALNQALHQEMERDDLVVTLGEDVGVDGGVFRVTEGLLDQYGKQRVLDTPLSESGIVGASIGMAANGIKPVAEIQFSGFLYPAFDQLISHASRIRHRSQGVFSCPLVVRTPYGGGIRALEHHAESMEALYMHTPGLRVVIPSRPYTAKGLLLAAIREPDPVVFLEPKKNYRSVKEDVPVKDYEIQLGKADVVEKGQDITIISYGAMLQECRKAVEQSDYDAELIDIQSIYPLDTETIVRSIKKTGKCVVVHEGPKTGGVAAEIIARINEEALLHLEAPIERVTGFDTIFPYFKLEDYYLPSQKRIAEAMESVMTF